MSRQVTPPSNERRLQRLLVALENELLEASDEEVRQAAGDLGINPDMKGSIAWMGVLFPGKMRRDEVLDRDAIDAIRKLLRRRLTPPDEQDG
jgi:hypothetical protein